MRDTFPYTARWDSVGLDCSTCTQFGAPPAWPDTHRLSCCRLHRLSLAVELGGDGYKYGEWFCRDFSDNGRTHRPALHHFMTQQASFAARVLYGFYGENGNLKEIAFAALPPGCREPPV